MATKKLILWFWFHAWFPFTAFDQRYLRILNLDFTVSPKESLSRNGPIRTSDENLLLVQSLVFIGFRGATTSDEDFFSDLQLQSARFQSSIITLKIETFSACILAYCGSSPSQILQRLGMAVSVKDQQIHWVY